MSEYPVLKTLLAAALMTGLFSASLSGDELKFANQFTRPGKAFRLYPANAKKKSEPMKIQKIGDARLGVLDRSKHASAATSLQWPFSTGLTAPGTLIMTVTDKSNADKTDVAWKINFNLKNGKNGSAGRQNLTHQVSTKLSPKRMEVTIPPNTNSLQMIIAPKLAPDQSWYLQDIKLQYAPDNVKVSKFTPAPGVKPSQWQNVQAADCFFNRHTALAATVQTSARLCFDNKNLYVGYICSEPDMSLLKATNTQRDGNLWEDDCVEFIFFDPVSNQAKHLIVNPANTQFDCQRLQAQAGDPHKPHPWDGKWDSAVWKNSDSWEVMLSIPWKTLGFDSVPKHQVAVNIARERIADGGKYMWNCYQGGFDEVNNFALLDFSKQELVRSRKVEKINYLPKRARKVYKEVLTDIKKDWKCDMSSEDFFLVYQPAAVRKKHTLATWKVWQEQNLRDLAAAGILGPVYPWAMQPRNTELTLDDFYRIHHETGLTLPAHLDPQHARAFKMGAKPSMYSPPKRVWVDPSDPALIKSLCMSIDELAEKFAKEPKLKKIISFLEGIDEPTNRIESLYSCKNNPEWKNYLTEFSDKLKAEYGFGKFGLYDAFVPQDEEFAFKRIAFWRWWNDRYAKHTKTITEHARKKLGLEVFAICRNNCSSIDDSDPALLADGNIVAGCDPYPTSTKASYGMARALYHTGFCTKLFRDLAPLATVVSYGQSFNYHGGTPSRAELREWVSQVLKTGADYLRWYGGGASRQNPALFNEAFDISYQLQTSVPKLKLPTETRTAIYYSDYDRWGLNDRPVHAPYTLYTLLGEHNAMWFRFISKHKMDLTGIKLLYIPRMRFTDPVITAKIVSFVRDGGTIVVLDPDFMTYNIDGTAVPERELLIGTKLQKRELFIPRLQYGKHQLPLSKVMYLQLPESGKLHAYNFAQLPAGAKVLATYNDKKPAIIERPFGKGKVIFSAALAFGSSDVATAPQGWKNFTADLGKAVGEKSNLDIWFFELPEVKNKRFNIQPFN